MTATEILRMIETVDPAATAKLEEIDFKVWCFIHQPPKDSCFAMRKYPEYTRSRDVLKSIRPERWKFKINYIYPEEQELHGWFAFFQKTDPWKITRAQHLPTEELAELHAIIQAIEYERAK